MSEVYRFLLTHMDWWTDLWYFIITMVGAIITQLLSLPIGTVGTLPFLHKYFPKKKKVWYERTNCILLVFAGTVLSFFILEPDSVRASLCAGLTWCGTLQSLGLSLKSENND